MGYALDLETWPRKATWLYFKDFDHPYFNICADMDVTHLLSHVKESHTSFFIASLYVSLRAANEIEPFRYRMKGGGVQVHDVVHGGSTVLNEDESFSFCYFNYSEDFEQFYCNAEQVLASFKAGEKNLNPKDDMEDVIHYSVLPWVSFTSFSHARRHNKTDSIPKIVFGGYRCEGGQTKMPVSVEVHHALMDGLHVGRYFQRFQELCNQFQR